MLLIARRCTKPHVPTGSVLTLGRGSWKIYGRVGAGLQAV